MNFLHSGCETKTEKPFGAVAAKEEFGRSISWTNIQIKIHLKEVVYTFWQNVSPYYPLQSEVCKRPVILKPDFIRC